MVELSGLFFAVLILPVVCTLLPHLQLHLQRVERLDDRLIRVLPFLLFTLFLSLFPRQEVFLALLRRLFGNFLCFLMAVFNLLDVDLVRLDGLHLQLALLGLHFLKCILPFHAEGVCFDNLFLHHVATLLLRSGFLFLSFLQLVLHTVEILSHLAVDVDL